MNDEFLAVLFCVYIDELLNELAGIKIGCNSGRNFLGCSAHAGDVI